MPGEQGDRERNMTTSRRDLLKFGVLGGAALATGLPGASVSAQGSELTIAYNVN
jgi:hypothetical protein